MVVEVGAKVEGVKPGDRVAAIVLAMKTCAEYVIASTRLISFGGGSVPASDIFVLPQRVTGAQALCYLVNYRCAHLAVHFWGRTPAGSRVLVHGAAGGMGSLVVQIAAEHGCEVIATVRTAKEAEHCLRMGAAHTVDLIEEDYVQRVKDLTGGKLVERCFNGVGGFTINRDPQVVAPFGEIMAYGYTAGKPDFDIFHVPKCLAIKSFSYNDFFPIPAYREATEAMLEQFASKTLMEAEIMPLAAIAEAHRRLDEGDVIGKIVLAP